MNKLKRLLGIVWMISGPLIFVLLISSAIQNIDSSGNRDINKPIPWIIILTVITPVTIGISIFGYYAWTGAYDSRSNIEGMSRQNP